MKNCNSFLKWCLLLILSSGAASLSATATNCAATRVLVEDGPVQRTYLNKSTTPRVGASSWKYNRQKRAGNSPVDKTLSVEITYDDFVEHLGLGYDRTVRVIPQDAGNSIIMDVGNEDVVDGVWNMPNLAAFQGLQTLTYYSREITTVDDAQYFDEPTHAFQLGADSYQLLELVADDGEFTGYLDNQGYTDPEFYYEMYSTLTPVPMAQGLGVYESEYGPEDCGFFGDGCLGLPDEDHFTIIQTYEEVASGILNTYDGESAEGLKLRNTDSITIFDADGLILDIVVTNYIVWYTKSGHFVKARLATDAPWVGTTTFLDFEYQKLSASVLPVEWLAINAEVIKNREIKVNWSTATETQNERFIVERSADGVRFSPLAGVDAVGNSQVRQDYSYTDEAPLDGFNYYRIQQQDFNGQDTYSSIVSALVTKTASDDELVELYPNPGRDEVYFSRPADYELMTIDGQLLAKGRVEQELNVTDLPAGTYLVRIDGGEAYRWIKL